MSWGKGVRFIDIDVQHRDVPQPWKCIRYPHYVSVKQNSEGSIIGTSVHERVVWCVRACVRVYACAWRMRDAGEHREYCGQRPDSADVQTYDACMSFENSASSDATLPPFLFSFFRPPPAAARQPGFNDARLRLRRCSEHRTTVHQQGSKVSHASTPFPRRHSPHECRRRL